jgi:uncharacterized protein (TIGR03083 family)
MADDLWSKVAEERRALAADLRGLLDEQWDTPSWCEGWSVRDVVAHVAASARISPFAFLPKLARAGFSFTRMQDRDIAVQRGASPAETLANLEAIITSTTAPPGPKVTWLGEAVIHGEDARRPLGLRRDHPADHVVPVADFYKGSNLVVGAKKRIAGLRLRATDADWTHGDGPEVSGRLVDLVLAMTGRRPVLDDLEGPGVDVLRSR